jgi:hypothetical protein
VAGALVAAAGLAAGVLVWAAALGGSTGRLLLTAPPFAGRWELRLPPGMLGAAALGTALVLRWPDHCERLRWRSLLATSAFVSFAWTSVLAISAGWHRLGAPLDTRWEYLPLARRIDDPAAFVRTFVEQLPSYPTHVKAHPPGPVLGFWLLDRLSLGTTAVAVLVVAAFASAAPAVLVAADRLAGRSAARRIAPFAGLVPAVVWAGTSADAAFAAAVAWSVAAAAVALTTSRTMHSVAAAAACGLLAGVAATLTYGAPVLLAPVGAVLVLAAARRRWWVPLTALAVSLVPLAALAAVGFDWLDGYAATRDAYWSGVASDRPYRYFAVANVAVLAVACGPAVVGGLALLRDRRLWLLVGATVAGVLVATMSGLAKGEVERIWLPFVPCLTVATAALPTEASTRRVWLGAQLAVALTLQATLQSPW